MSSPSRVLGKALSVAGMGRVDLAVRVPLSLLCPSPPSISLVFSVPVCGSHQVMLEGSCRESVGA